mmetsp:Transcript_21715/g.38366  ORF Transcript_21715/g.38366 Transcript_21715/m.38366 type:complete len:222 (+) Transcript_21715:309-974(+)
MGRKMDKKEQISSRIWQAAGSGEINAVAELMRSKDADVNTRGKNGWTLLHFASKSGQYELCQLLLDGGADVKAHDKSGSTPLHYAAAEGRSEICKLLIESGSRVNVKSGDGWTPLHAAAQRGSVSTCGSLLQFGADLLAEDRDGEKPFDVAVRMGFEQVAELLVFESFDLDDNEDAECTICLYQFDLVKRLRTELDCEHVACSRCVSAMDNCHICGMEIYK